MAITVTLNAETKTVLSMYLVDTNIISELCIGNSPNRGVIEFFYNLKANKEDCYLSVITLGELRRGIEMVRQPTSKCASPTPTM